MKFLRSNPVSRRFIIRAAGASLALPFLPSLLPRRARAAVAPASVVVFRQANGVQTEFANFGEPERFWPRNYGPLGTSLADVDADRAVSELRDFADHLLLIRRLDIPNEYGSGCGHTHGLNQLLTASRPSGGKSMSLATGESIDNRIARELHPGIEPITFFCGRREGYIDDGLSYRGPMLLRTGERDPQKVYERMTGGSSSQNHIDLSRASINDVVRDELTTLQNSSTLSFEDRERLALHLEAVRELEVTLGCMADTMTLQALDGAATLLDTDAEVERVARLQMDVTALALACGYVRAATIQMGGGGSSTQFVVNGATLPRYHGISHRNLTDGTPSANAESALRHHQIDRIHGRLFAHLLGRLQTYGILDSTVAMWCADMAVGPAHWFTSTPFIIAGSGNGYFKQGQVIDAAGQAHNRLLNTILNAVGLRNTDGTLIENFGDGGRPPGELAAAKA